MIRLMPPTSDQGDDSRARRLSDEQHLFILRVSLFGAAQRLEGEGLKSLVELLEEVLTVARMGLRASAPPP